MANVSTVKKTGPASVADVTGSKKGPKKGVPRGKLTKPLFPSNQERIGAITNTARTIAARNGGYVNAEMIHRELSSHPVYQETVFGPEGVEPAVAYSLLTVAKVKDWYKGALDLLTEKGIDPHAAPEDGGPKKGALPVLASMRGGKAFVDTDEL